MFNNENRRAYSAKVDAMRDVLQLAEKEHRELTQTEMQRFDELDREAGSLAKQLGFEMTGDRSDRAKYLAGLENQVANPHAIRNFGVNESAPEVWRDRTTGEEVRVYRPNQSLTAHAASSGEFGDLTVGGFMRAMILGPKSDAEKRALALGSDSTGGFTVAPDLLPQFIDLLRAKSHVVKAGAQTVTLATGKVTTIARLASDVTAAWRAENAVISPADVTFEGVTFSPKSLGALIVVSQELADDSANLQQMLENSFAKAFANALDSAALFGAGTGSEPKGIKNITNVNSYSMGTNGASPTDFSSILQAIKLIDDDNGPEPTAAIMHPRTQLAFDNLQDTLHQPLQRPNRIKALPFYSTSKISITETQGSSNAASRLYLGDFSQLMLGMRQDLRIQVLKERYADYVQYGFLGTLRADVAVTHPEAFGMVVGLI